MSQILLWSGLGLVCIGTGMQDDQERRFQRVLEGCQNGVVQLHAWKSGKESTGTGFVVAADGTLITNYHVIRDAQRVFADFLFDRDLASYECDLVDARPEYDLAALRLQAGRRPAQLSALTVRGDTVSTVRFPLEILAVGHQVFRAGAESAPIRLAWSPSRGRLVASRLRKDLFRDAVGDDMSRLYQLEGTAAHGMSGGPVLDADGGVLGVLMAGIGVNLDGQPSNVGFCIPGDDVRRLNLSNPASIFAGRDRAPQYRHDFANTGLQYLSADTPPTIPVLGSTSAVAPVAADAQLIVASRNWGPVLNDPQWILQQYVDDKPRFTFFITPQLLAEISERHSIIHVTNPYFQYSVLIPECFDLSEHIDKDGRTMRAIITSSNPDLPRPFNTLTITARKVAPYQPAEMEQLLYRLRNEFFSRDLGLTIVDPMNLPTELRPTQVVIPGRSGQVVAHGPRHLSDDRVRFSFDGRQARLWELYETWDEFGLSHLVLYALQGDNFVVGHYVYATESILGDQLPEDFFERFFMANTISFVD